MNFDIVLEIKSVKNILIRFLLPNKKHFLMLIIHQIIHRKFNQIIN